MKQRGRKSIGDLSAVSFENARPMAPDWLSDAQRETWREIVDSLPADYFRPGDTPLLAAYCVHAATQRQAAERITADGVILKTEKGWPFPNPLLQVLNQQSNAMATLAAKLRLCPSARMVQNAADKKAGDGVKGPRPWDEKDKPHTLAS